jgi:type III pantothenate kinase
MRVAMVSEHASPLAALGGVDAGGQNVHVAALACAMARRGVEVVVHTRRDDPDLPARVAMAPGVEVQHVDAGPAAAIPKDELLPHMPRFAAQLGEAWRRERPDVVHSHFWMSGWAAMEAAAPLGIPVAHTFHALGVVKRRYQGERDPSPAERTGIERDLVRRVDRIVATCTDEVFELIRMGAPSPHVTVIPCGVDLELFRPDGPAAARAPGLSRLLCIGRLVERKGIGNVISSLAGVPDAELVIAGGPDRERLDEDPEARRLTLLAEEAGVADRVHLCGGLQRSAVPPLMRSVDAVVSAPWYEPFGIVPLEAMACGVPVVASAVGGMIDSVVDGVTGVHVPPRDPERLAAVLADLLGDPDRRRAYGRAGVERARRLYDWNRIAASSLDVYERVRRRAPRRRPAASNGSFRLPPTAAEHLAAVEDALHRLEGELDQLTSWGERLASRLLEGGRLLVVGNGGSAAQAQHLTAELVGRYQSEREPLSAICLHGDTSSLTAICNDYGIEEAFARQVRAHGRGGDVLLALSTSGRSPNVLAAVRAARDCGLDTWALSGGAPNPLVELCDEAVALDCGSAATVQELHQVALHLVCGAIDREVALRTLGRSREEVHA